uniref:Uncharacterized protein n=1 Tax=Molossus molossus TaxID=27622 RepID=A0A7J8HJ49_MOLMO|nr:hypothetical protein HJG59_011069 [Molossus molossus]
MVRFPLSSLRSWSPEKVLRDTPASPLFCCTQVTHSRCLFSGGSFGSARATCPLAFGCWNAFQHHETQGCATAICVLNFNLFSHVPDQQAYFPSTGEYMVKNPVFLLIVLRTTEKKWQKTQQR